MRSDERPGVITPETMNWKMMLVMGVVLVVGGVLSVLNPFAASLAVNTLAGAVFLIGGSIQLMLALRGEEGSSKGRLAAGLTGVLMIVLALSLWFDPLAGLMTLTLLTALLFFLLGLVRLWFAMRMRHRARWVWVAISGGLSILLSIIIFAALPEAALTTLGLLLGIELTMSGAAISALALAARSS